MGTFQSLEKSGDVQALSQLPVPTPPEITSWIWIWGCPGGSAFSSVPTLGPTVARGLRVVSHLSGSTKGICIIISQAQNQHFKIKNDCVI